MQGSISVTHTIEGCLQIIQNYSMFSLKNSYIVLAFLKHNFLSVVWLDIPNTSRKNKCITCWAK